jgi:hypothetical protein
MNQPTTYEQLIAQKLQELAVPDQADAIWATIEHQLNIEMPGIDPGSGGPNPSSWWMGGGGLFTLFVAVVTYISVSNQNFESQRSIKEHPSSVQYPKPLKNKGGSKNASPPREGKLNEPAAIRPPAGESEVAKEAGQPSVQDSTTKAQPEKLIIQPAEPARPSDTAGPKRKVRGVQGITDADYRLIPSVKDSLRRKN